MHLQRGRFECGVAMPLWFFFSSRRRHTRSKRDWSSDVCSSDLRDDAADDRLGDVHGFAPLIRGEREIGRASCRERVEISVVAVSVKKKIDSGQSAEEDDAIVTGGSEVSHG